jgi:hypothetical protein
VLRAFTPNDAKALRDTAKTYPRSVYYSIEDSLTQMGIGQALVTVLNSKGIPTEVAYTHLVPPIAVMGPLDPAKAKDIMQQSEMFEKYQESVDPESAAEILDKRLRPTPVEQKPVESPANTVKPSARKEKSMIEQVMSSSVTRSIGRELVRGIFGVLFGGSRSSTRRRR